MESVRDKKERRKEGDGAWLIAIPKKYVFHVEKF
jgi:hypothetical protein